MIYYCIFAVLWLLGLYEVAIEKNKRISRGKNVLSIIVVFVLIMFAGLRYGVGRDFFSYQKHYELIKNNPANIFNVSLELGYSVLCYLLPSFKSLMVLTAVITVMARYKSFELLKVENIVFVPLLFYYSSDYLFYDMGVVRQGMAMSICFLSVKHIPKRKLVFFVYVAIASLFHWSSILFVILYFVSNKEYSRKIYYLIILISILIFMFGHINIELIQNTLSMFHLDLISHKFNKFLGYASTSLLLSLVRRIVFAIFFIELFKHPKMRAWDLSIPKRNTSKYTWLYINGYVLSILMLAISSDLFSSIGGRFSAIFYSHYIYIYSVIFSNKKSKAINILYYIIFSVLAFCTLNKEIGNINANYLPYHFRIN